jgi:prolipoprotein diacylglyceryl transferase
VTAALYASIPSPGFNRIDLGPLSFHVYGLMYALAVIGAVWVTTVRWKKLGGKGDLVQECALYGFPAGLVGGRLYHVITSWNEVPKHWWGPFAIWEGGMGVIGGIALGTLAGIWVLRRRGANVVVFMDCVAPGLLVAQAIGRLGNWFNQELYGKPTSLPWGLEIDRDHRPEGYLDQSTFQPTFLYEGLWNLILAACLVWLGHHRGIRAPGLFALYVAGYGAFRIIEEVALRIDDAHHILGMRLNFWVACGVFLIGVAWFAWTQRRPEEPDSSQPITEARPRRRARTAAAR